VARRRASGAGRNPWHPEPFGCAAPELVEGQGTLREESSVLVARRPLAALGVTWMVTLWASAATTSHATAGRRRGGPVAPGATHGTPSPSAPRLPSLSRGRVHAARGLAAQGQRQIPHTKSSWQFRIVVAVIAHRDAMCGNLQSKICNRKWYHCACGSVRNDMNPMVLRRSVWPGGGPVAPGATHGTPSPSAARLPSLSRGRVHSARNLPSSWLEDPSLRSG